MEAWIETDMGVVNNLAGRSPPTWRRGLKPYKQLDKLLVDLSPPTWRRGLKPFYSEPCDECCGRLPRGGVD